MEKWQSHETIIIWIIILGFILIVLMSFFAFYIKSSSDKIQNNLEKENQLRLAHQRDLLQTFIAAQENERKRIAADIHDGLIGKLIAAKIQFENSSADAPIELLNNSIDLARNISHNLSDPLIEFECLEDLITDLVTPWKSRINIDLRFDIRDQLQEPNGFKAQLLRVLQELLVNVDKHAMATQINLTFRKSQKFITLLLTDNGMGFTNDNAKNGLGLKNIESRIQFLNGIHRIKSEERKGTSVLIMFNVLK